MPYIDKEYYTDEYKGIPVLDDDDFKRLATRASDTIDFITNHQLVSVEFDELGTFIKKQVKKATAAQIEYMLISGQSASIGSGGFGQVRIGNFSYGSKQGDSEESRYERMTSATVLSHLYPTNLLYKGVAVHD